MSRYPLDEHQLHELDDEGETIVVYWPEMCKAKSVHGFIMTQVCIVNLPNKARKLGCCLSMAAYPLDSLLPGRGSCDQCLLRSLGGIA